MTIYVPYGRIVERVFREFDGDISEKWKDLPEEVKRSNPDFYRECVIASRDEVDFYYVASASPHTVICPEGEEYQLNDKEAWREFYSSLPLHERRVIKSCSAQLRDLIDIVDRRYDGCWMCKKID